jgi:hypothetical protein
MLSYFAAWILKAGMPVFKRSGPTFDTGGETRAKAEAGSCVMTGELARELQLVQENARLIFVRKAAFVALCGYITMPITGYGWRI